MSVKQQSMLYRRNDVNPNKGKIADIWTPTPQPIHLHPVTSAVIAALEDKVKEQRFYFGVTMALCLPIAILGGMLIERVLVWLMYAS